MRKGTHHPNGGLIEREEKKNFKKALKDQREQDT